jgi:hypothetical protein
MVDNLSTIKSNPLRLLNEGMTFEQKQQVLLKEFMKDSDFVFDWYNTELEMTYGEYAARMFENDLHNAKKELGRKLKPVEIENAYNRLNEALKNGCN